MKPRPAAKRVTLREVRSANVDLTPVMSLFIILVPLLLVTAVFERMAAVKTYLPEASTLAAQPDKEKKLPTGMVEIRLLLREDGLELEATLSHDPDGKEKETYEDTRYSFPVEADQYPLGELQKVLKNLKHDYPRQEEIVFLVADGVTYDVIVQAMDTAREEIYEENGQKSSRPLFPTISLSEPFREDGVFEGLREGTKELNETLGIP
ncbi:MAG: biopolymer transporter ExbD [bacterium]